MAGTGWLRTVGGEGQHADRRGVIALQGAGHLPVVALIEDDLPFQPRDSEVCAIRVPGQHAPRLALAGDLQPLNKRYENHCKTLEGSSRVSLVSSWA